jgi:hypothetical protein
MTPIETFVVVLLIGIVAGAIAQRPSSSFQNQSRGNGASATQLKIVLGKDAGGPKIRSDT